MSRLFRGTSFWGSSYRERLTSGWAAAGVASPRGRAAPWILSDAPYSILDSSIHNLRPTRLPNPPTPSPPQFPPLHKPPPPATSGACLAARWGVPVFVRRATIWPGNRFHVPEKIFWPKGGARQVNVSGVLSARAASGVETAGPAASGGGCEAGSMKRLVVSWWMDYGSRYHDPAARERRQEPPPRNG